VGAAETYHAHAATDITSGFLNIANGGTGATTAADARTNLGITPANIGAATSGHTHTLSLASSTGTSAITLAASTKYQLTAGGSTYIFTTPPNTTYSNITVDEVTTGTATTGRLISAKTIKDLHAYSGGSATKVSSTTGT